MYFYFIYGRESISSLYPLSLNAQVVGAVPAHSKFGAALTCTIILQLDPTAPHQQDFQKYFKALPIYEHLSKDIWKNRIYASPTNRIYVITHEGLSSNRRSQGSFRALFSIHIQFPSAGNTSSPRHLNLHKRGKFDYVTVQLNASVHLTEKKYISVPCFIISGAKMSKCRRHQKCRNEPGTICTSLILT